VREKKAVASKKESPVHAIKGRASPSYIIDGKGLAVVDVCFPSDAERILDYVEEEMERDIKDIKLIVLTHSHLDHVNGVDSLKDATGAELAAYINARKYLAGKKATRCASWDKLMEFAGFMIKNGLPRPSLKDTFSMRWSGIPGIKRGIRSGLNHRLKDGENLPGHANWKVVYTPGHTDDSICLYNADHRMLISGDTLINSDGKLILNPLLRLDDRAMKESLEKLKQLDIDTVYPGWGEPLHRKNIVKKIKEE
jgi:hydroxyacylglutathione hydrolase